MQPDPIREQPAPEKPTPPASPAGDPQADVAPTTAWKQSDGPSGPRSNDPKRDPKPDDGPA